MSDVAGELRAPHDRISDSSLLGFGSCMAVREARNPETGLDGFDPDRTLLLFSSEPYPFHQQEDIISALPFASALVDGEAYGWFGIRTLRFLEGCAAGT